MINKKKFCNGCQRDKYIYKNVTIDGIRCKLCKECSFKEDLKVQPNSKQIRTKSKKKVLEDKLYTVLRKKYMEQHPECQARLSGCTSVATEIHHKEGRSINTNNVDTWVSICRTCHMYIHLNPAEARELNLLK